MIAKLFDRCHQTVFKLLQQPKYLLTLRLTLLLVLFNGISKLELAELPETILCGAMLTSSKLLTHRVIWLALGVAAVVSNVKFWFISFNHDYLITYWCLICVLAVFTKTPKRVMRWNARLSIGLCFFFATVWKFLSGEYLDGSFVHLTFLLDQRLEMGAFVFGGLNSEVLQGNREVFTLMQATDPLTAETILQTSPLMAWLSLVLSYWTLLIEGTIAIAFLSPRPQGLARNRDWLLILFLVTTYPFIPVFAFAAILALLGFAQCSVHHSNRLVVYLLAFILIPLWMTLPHAMFYLFTSLI